VTDIEKIIWGGFAAVTVFVIGQLISRIFIEPLHELRKIIGEVRFNLAFHRTTIRTPIARTEENTKVAREALIKSSSELITKLHAMPVILISPNLICRCLTFGIVPTRNDIDGAAIALRGLSTYVYVGSEKMDENHIDIINRRIARIESLLRLRPLE